MPDSPVDRQLPRKRWRGAALWLVLGACAALLTFGLSRARAKLPSVPRGEVLVEPVRKERVVQKVSGPGRLVPIDVRWLTATHRARVERVLIRPGDRVVAGQVVAELRNPDMDLALLEAQRQLAAAGVQISGIQRELDQRSYELEISLNESREQHQLAQRQLERQKTLAGEGLASRSELERALSAEQELEGRVALAEKRQGNELRRRASDLGPAYQLQKSLERIVAYSRRQLEELTLRSEAAGLVHSVSIEPGQWVESGVVMAKIIVSQELKAELRIDELLARDVAADQPALIVAGNLQLKGHVTLVDPRASQGAVSVEVALDEKNSGLRADQRISGEIEVRQYPEALTLKAPAQVTRPGRFFLYALREADTLVRTPVELKPATVDRVIVSSGLRLGERVVISDMERFRDFERLVLE